MLFPPKFVEFDDGLIAIAPHTGHHTSIVQVCHPRNPVSAGFLYLSTDGYRFCGESLTLRLKADPSTSMNEKDMFYVFERLPNSRYGYELKMIFSNEDAAKKYAETFLEAIVCKGVWGNTKLSDYSSPIFQNIPVQDDEISALVLKSVIGLFFMETFPIEVSVEM